MAVIVESPKQHKFGSFRRAAREGGFLGCFMVPRQSKRSAGSTTPSSKERTIRFSASDADTAKVPLLDPNAEVTDSGSFVFSPIAPSSASQLLESPSFRTLSDPPLSAFSYCERNPSSVTTPCLSPKFGGIPHPLPPLDSASPFQISLGSTAAKPVWLPLPVPDLRLTIPEPRAALPRSTSGASSNDESSSSEGSTMRAASELQGGGVGSWSIRRGKVAPAGGLPLPPACVATQLLPGLESFAFEDLARGTRAFAPECCMEKCEFGAVYRAWVRHLPAERSTLRELTVVRLNIDESKSLKNWRADVQMLSQLSDPNICVIKGYCASEGKVSSERLLVFEQSPNGTLHDYLCGSRSKTQLDWAARISIVLGAARGLLYLHDRAPLQIVYREFKSSSVLLDKDYTPRLAGYGLAVTTTTPPSDKLLRPSFTSPVTEKSSHVAHAKRNVWSFGLVLVELLTGKSTSSESAFQCDEKRFVHWATPFLRDESKLVRVLDPRVKGKCSVTGAVRVAELASWCLRRKATKRPSMATVVDTLRSIKENFGGRALLRQINRAPSFGHGTLSFRTDPEPRSKFVDADPNLMLMASMLTPSEDEDSSSSSSVCAVQTCKTSTFDQHFEAASVC